MSINKIQLQELIQNVLEYVDPKLATPAAVNLLMGTAAVESQLGTYIKQLAGGPARGIFQMEGRTHEDHWANYLYDSDHTELRNRIMDFLSKKGNTTVVGKNHPELRWNLAYAICMARVHYLRVKDPLPAPNDVLAMAKYWKKYYNTTAGAGTIEDFLEAYNKYVVHGG